MKVTTTLLLLAACGSAPVARPPPSPATPPEYQAPPPAPPTVKPGAPAVTAVRHYAAGDHTDAGLTFNAHVHFDGTGDVGFWVQIHVDDEYLNLYGGTVASDGTWTAGPYDGEFITEGWHQVRVRLTTDQYEGWGIDGPLSEPRCFYFP